MMANKKGFILYLDLLGNIEPLNMEERGILFTALLCDQNGIELPDMNAITKVAFSFIKKALDANEEKYNKISEARREAGKQGGRPKANESNEKQIKANESKTKQTEANESKAKAKESNDKAKKPITDNREQITDNKEQITDIEEYKERSADAPRNANEKPVKHKHGENKNVLLTDEELASLQERFPADWENRIDNLSWYLSNHKDKYTSHYKTILAWARNDQQKAQTPYKSKTAQELDATYKMLDDWVKNGVE